MTSCYLLFSGESKKNKNTTFQDCQVLLYSGIHFYFSLMFILVYFTALLFTHKMKWKEKSNLNLWKRVASIHFKCPYCFEQSILVDYQRKLCTNYDCNNENNNHLLT